MIFQALVEDNQSFFLFILKSSFLDLIVGLAVGAYGAAGATEDILNGLVLHFEEAPDLHSHEDGANPRTQETEAAHAKGVIQEAAMGVGIHLLGGQVVEDEATAKSAQAAGAGTSGAAVEGSDLVIASLPQLFLNVLGRVLAVDRVLVRHVVFSL